MNNYSLYTILYIKIESLFAKGVNKIIIRKSQDSRQTGFLKGLDKMYLLLCLCCSSFSCVALYSWCAYAQVSSGYRIFLVQLGASAVGIIMATIISNINYRSLASLWPFHVAATWGMVLLTFLRIGPFGQSNGTENFSWIGLPFGLSLQPTELAKISFIITFALHISNVKDKINRPKTLLLLLLHMLAPVLLVMLQGDDGTALVFVVIGLVMLFVAGISYKYILSVLGTLVLSSPIWFPYIWNNVLDGYQRNRILVIFFPEEYKGTAYQQDMAKISIGAGELTGRGFFAPEHNYVPEVYNDFIFSYIAEATGFIGSILVILLLLAVIFKTFATAIRAQDKLGSLICVGVSAVFITQTFLNIGMNLSLLPVIGITLPFFSSGGTSVTMMYLSIGVVLSVYRYNKKNIFDE